MTGDLDKYVDGLPEIYREILAVFPKVEPSRKMGFGLAFQTIVVALDNRYAIDEVQLACARLAQFKIVEIRNGIFVHPTRLGEDMIAYLTGRTAPMDRVPPLSPPPVPV